MFDVAHYDTSIVEFVKILAKGIKFMFDVSSNPMLNMSTQLCTANVQYFCAKKRSGHIRPSYKMKANTKLCEHHCIPLI